LADVYTSSIVRSITERDSGDWLGGGLMDRRFLRAVELSLAADGKFWNVVVKDAAGRSVASAFLSLYSVDPALFVERAWQTRLRQVRRLFPVLRRLPVVLCGTPVSAGESHLRMAAEADRPAVVQVLEKTMLKLAQRHGSRILVFKEFDDADPALHAALEARGYLRKASWPMNQLPTHFQSFDELCASARSKYRNQIQRSVKKFARSGLRIEHVQDGAVVERFYTDEVHQLYLAVLERAEVKLEKLPAEFFRELARQFPREIVFTTAWQVDRIVGFVCSLHLGEEYFNLFCGIDYQVNELGEVYFNLLYKDSDFALRQRAKTINVGQASYEFKSRMGCFTRPRAFFVKICGHFMAPLLRQLGPLVFPPPPAPPLRSFFHEGSSGGEAVGPRIPPWGE
jgi:predicted N-acyltransferase